MAHKAWTLLLFLPAFHSGCASAQERKARAERDSLAAVEASWKFTHDGKCGGLVRPGKYVAVFHHEGPDSNRRYSIRQEKGRFGPHTIRSLIFLGPDTLIQWRGSSNRHEDGHWESQLTGSEPLVCGYACSGDKLRASCKERGLRRTWIHDEIRNGLPVEIFRLFRIRDDVLVEETAGLRAELDTTWVLDRW